MKTLKLIFIFLFLPFYLVTAQFQTTQEQVNGFFSDILTKDKKKIKERLADEFLKYITPEKLVEILDKFEKDYGQFVKAELIQGNKLDVVYTQATMPGSITFNSENKIVGLWFGMPKMKEDNLEKLKIELANLNGVYSVCIRKNGKEYFSINKDKPLGIGSAFKLFVLKTLKNDIESGKEKWDRVVEIQEKNKSLPTGILQNWRDKTPVTVATLANLMISISDNTATDRLIMLLGRENIEINSPERMKPFLKTMEMFKIKIGSTKEYQEKYFAADLKGKRKILAELDTVNIKLNVDTWKEPKLIDKLEWFATTEELCTLIEDLKDFPPLSINPGLAKKEEWYYIGFKGGSEPGVLNYTHILKKTEGSEIISISATCNNQEQDIQSEFTTIVGRIIELMKK